VGVSAMRGLLSLFSLLVLLAAFPRRAGADRCERAYCRCIPASVLGLTDEELVRRRLDLAERVVLGRVVRIDSLAPRLVEHGPDTVQVRELAARVAVSRIWKGPRVDTLTVVFGSTPIASSCDLALQAGFSYVIFAVPYDDGAMRTRQCTGTGAEVDAAATIAVLGAGEVPRR
jgi:hypothetical protein